MTGAAGFGLSILVKPTSTGRISKSWAQRLRVEDRPFNIGLGSFPAVTLSEARNRALANVRKVETGVDPRRQPNLTPTFSQAMEQAIEVLRPGWKQGGKAEHQMRFLLTEYALPHIGKRRIDTIKPMDLLDFLAPLAIEKPATGVKLKARLGQVFQWAIAQGLRTDNPADRNINGALPKTSTKAHFKALPFDQVADALSKIRSSGAYLGTKLAFEFLVLTAARSGEVRGATWDEVDLDAATWTIPAARMKAGREHRIPLSGPALQVLTAALPLSGGAGLVFPSARGKEISDSTLSKLLRENGLRCVPHGMRSSFRDWCAESGVDRQTAESALAHTVGDATEAAYLRSDLLTLRRAAMGRLGRIFDNQLSLRYSWDN